MHNHLHQDAHHDQSQAAQPKDKVEEEQKELHTLQTSCYGHVVQ
uniref:Uncharacterized protein n=1 Tax=Anguilla anguilla TaxID=7936 RepID=A0A0E9V7E2_ANGAN